MLKAAAPVTTPLFCFFLYSSSATCSSTVTIDSATRSSLGSFLPRTASRMTSFISVPLIFCLVISNGLPS